MHQPVAETGARSAAGPEVDCVGLPLPTLAVSYAPQSSKWALGDSAGTVSYGKARAY